MKHSSAFLATFGLSLLAAAATVAPDIQYKFITEIPIGGGSGWDYLLADVATGRLYVSHKTKVVVIDMATNKIVGNVTDTPGVHGFAVAAELKKGFSSNGQESKVSVVDLATLKTLTKVPTGANPDGIFYEPTVGEVWTFNGRGHSATVIDAKTDKVLVEAIDLGGKPEGAVADAVAGRVYVNVEDKNEVVVVDLKSHTVLSHWPIEGGESPTGMAFDRETHRLIIGCGNSKMVEMDSTNGKVVSTLDCGQGVDYASFDPATHLGFVSAGGSGTVTIAKVEADKLTLVQTLTTERGARTMTVDTKTHRIYLSNAKSRTDADSFKVLVYGIDGEMAGGADDGAKK